MATKEQPKHHKTHEGAEEKKTITTDEGEVTDLTDHEEYQEPLQAILQTLPAIAKGGLMATSRDILIDVFPTSLAEGQILLGQLVRVKQAMEQLIGAAREKMIHQA